MTGPRTTPDRTARQDRARRGRFGAAVPIAVTRAPTRGPIPDALAATPVCRVRSPSCARAVLAACTSADARLDLPAGTAGHAAAQRRGVGGSERGGEPAAEPGASAAAGGGRRSAP